MASPASSCRLTWGSICSTASPPTADERCPASPEGPRAFPDPEDLASLEPDDLKRHGFSSTKARTIIESARAIVAGELDLEALQRLEDGAAIERLTSLRGIGRWTAEYVLLRGLGRLHVFPGDDVGAHNKLRRLFGDRHAAGPRGRRPAGGALAPLRRRRLLPPAPGLAVPRWAHGPPGEAPERPRSGRQVKRDGGDHHSRLASQQTACGAVVQAAVKGKRGQRCRVRMSLGIQTAMQPGS